MWTAERTTLPLPMLVGRQREVLALPARGHTVVLGTAGSGKTTLAIRRAAFLADRRTPGGGTTLLLTFNNALVTYLRHLSDPTVAHLANVQVETYHKFARGYLAARGVRGRFICDQVRRPRILAEALGQVAARYRGHALFSRST